MRSAASTGEPAASSNPSSPSPSSTCRIPLRWRDLDYQGHVYHAEYLALADEGRTRWLGETLGVREPQNYLIAHISIDYLAELNRSAEFVEFGVDVEHVGNKSVRTRETLSVHSGSDTTIVARMTCVFLLWAPETRETRLLTDAERSTLTLPRTVP